MPPLMRHASPWLEKVLEPKVQNMGHTWSNWNFDVSVVTPDQTWSMCACGALFGSSAKIHRSCLSRIFVPTVQVEVGLFCTVQELMDGCMWLNNCKVTKNKAVSTTLGEKHSKQIPSKLIICQGLCWKVTCDTWPAVRLQARISKRLHCPKEQGRTCRNHVFSCKLLCNSYA